jgi:hypothetical protein
VYQRLALEDQPTQATERRRRRGAEPAFWDTPRSKLPASLCDSGGGGRASAEGIRPFVRASGRRRHATIGRCPTR